MTPQTAHTGDPDPRLLAALPQGRDTVPISRARRHVAAALIDGTSCPTCGQHAQLYRRRISRTVARQLISAYQTHGRAPFHAPSAGIRGGDFAKLAYWGLIAEQPNRRGDGGRAGWWRITETGDDFVHGRVRVTEYVLLYDGRRIGWDGPEVGITDIDKTFDLTDVTVHSVDGTNDDTAAAIVPVIPGQMTIDPPGTPDPNPGAADSAVTR